MEDIQIVIQYNGNWGDDGAYKDYNITGISIQYSCDFKNFQDTICKSLGINQMDTKVTIKCKLAENQPAFSVDNEMSLKFYKDIKRKEVDFMKYPLCVLTTQSQDNVCVIDNQNMCMDGLVDNQNICMDGDLTCVDISSNGIDEEMADHSVPTQCPINYFGDLVGLTSDIAQDTIRHIPLLIDQDKASCKQYGNCHDETTFPRFEKNPEFYKGDVFKNKAILKYFLAHCALTKDFCYKVEKSNRRNYWVSCIDNGCEWKLKASGIAGTDGFKIRKVAKEHTCTTRPRFQERRQLSSNFIATMVGVNLKNTKTKYGPLNIINDVHNKYGVEIKYQQAWRSKEKAKEQVLGNPTKSYGDVPTYLHLLKKANPGSYTRLQIMQDRSFNFAFIALAGCIEGWKHCRPQLVVDGTFLKESYGGTLITDCTYNAAGQIMPLAFAVVDSENNKSWEWFFDSFRKAFGYREGMCIISDRHESIKNASRQVYPEAGHYHCIYHILNNLKSNFKKNGDDLKRLFFGAAKAYTEQTYKYYMRELNKMDPRVVHYLKTDVVEEEWAAIYAKENRRQAMTSNIAESCNARNRLAREMPIIALLEQLRALIQEWSYNSKITARNTTSVLTEKYEQILMTNMIESKKLQVKPVLDYMYNVFEGKSNYLVNMKQRTYTCKEFQAEELPCRHACKVINNNYDDAYKYCSHYYMNATLKSTYLPDIYPITSEDWSQIPKDVQEIVVIRPNAKRKPGRIKKARIPTKAERKKRKTSSKCGNCKEVGHNKRTCKQPPK